MKPAGLSPRVRGTFFLRKHTGAQNETRLTEAPNTNASTHRLEYGTGLLLEEIRGRGFCLSNLAANGVYVLAGSVKIIHLCARGGEYAHSPLRELPKTRS